MAGFTPFTNNYSDMSDQNGYQFEFRCDICGSGYRSEFERSNLGTASNLLSGASNLIGGLWGASSAANTAKGLTDRGARDAALKKASEELMPKFKQCPRDHRWVDDNCWNEERGLCVNDAPKMASEMEAERANVALNQMREAMQSTTQFLGDLSTRNTMCTNCGKPVGSAKFCPSCGTPVAMTKCASCGADLAAGAKFCGSCGNPVASA
ncbi:MAG: zinc ribbon domain-containing protein [Chloroflexota bacterium]